MASEAEGHFVVDEAAMARFIGWSGPIGSDLRRRSKTLQFRARSSVGVRTGKLRADISTRESTRVDGLEVAVGNWGVRYAAAQHQGARPHEIHAKNAPFLRFYWAKMNTYVVTKKVMHPGNKANPYLRRWLREAVQ